MDLDKLKEKWAESHTNNLASPIVSEDKIFSIIHSKGKTALDRLINIEILGFALALFIFVVPFILEISLKGFSRYPPIQYIFWSICILGSFWQIYKIRLLKKIDVSKNSILQSAKHIMQYRLIIKKELIVCFFIFLLLIFVISSFFLDKMPTLETKQIFIKGMTILFFSSIVFLILSYKYLYFKNIKDLTRAIDEVKEFEEQNECNNYEP